MKIILLEDIKNTGKKNDLINVKDGFARFLITTNKAVFASKLSLEKLQKQQSNQKQIDNKKLEESKALKAKIETLKLKFKLKVGEKQTFGTVTTKTIIDCLASEHNLAIDKYMFVDNKKSYQLGKHIIKIKLDKNVTASLHIDVEKEK